MNNLAQRIKIETSPALVINTKAKEMIKDGIDIVNLSVGEPDFNTTPEASLAGIEAIATGFTRYAPAQGIFELREAICNKLKKENNLSYQPNEIVISNGAKHSLYNIFMALIEPGDEVILSTPYFLSYPSQIKLAGGKPVFVHTNQSTGYKMTPKQLEDSITPSTKALILNSPSNPTGAVYTRDELKNLAEVIEKYNFYIISDEIYEKIIYDSEHVSIASLSKKLKDRTLLVNGFSKAFAMTGWRLGYMAGNYKIVEAITAFQSATTGSISSISQKAGSVAFPYFDQSTVEEYRKRRDFILKELNKMPYISILNPSGAFYVFPSADKILGRKYKGEHIKSVDHLCRLLLEHSKLAVVPGSVFGAPNNFRISYANALPILKKAMTRLNEFLSNVK